MLTAADGATGDQFGFSVAISGSALVVGAPGDENGPVTDGGAAYAFRFDGSTWNEDGKLNTLESVDFGMFGFSVALEGANLVVSSGSLQYSGVESGGAQIYEYDGSAWRDTAVLLPSDAAPGDNFGYSASVSGDFIGVGSYRDDDNGTDTGAVYFFGNAPAVPPTLLCMPAGGSAIDISWIDESTYLSIDVFVDGELVTTVPGTQNSAQVMVPNPGLMHEVCLVATTICFAVTPSVCCTVELGTPFIRGDCNASGPINISSR